MKFPYNGLIEKEMQALIYKYIEISLDNLYKADLHLICREIKLPNERVLFKHASERSIVFRFGLYLHTLLNMDEKFKLIDLDFEYNRDELDVKRINPDEPIIPDLILHERGCNRNNLLVIEFKTYWNTYLDRDKEKLSELTTPEKRFEYAYGLSIIIAKTRNEVRKKWFVSGKVLSETDDKYFNKESSGSFT